MLLNVLKRVSADTGYHEVNQRTTLLNILQQGADKLHEILECNAIYREVTLVVRPDAVVALPSFIGSLKGIRPQSFDAPCDTTSMIPRYVTDTLKYKDRNWRIIGNSPIHTDLEALTLLRFEASVDPTATILVSGQSNFASTYEESVTLVNGVGTTINLFGLSIFNIASFSSRTGNVIVKQATDMAEIAILYNNEQKTNYKLVDVSQYSWPSETSDGNCLVDVLYKLPRVLLTKDTDSFYAGDEYDDAWYHMAMHCYYLPLENRKEDAKDQRAYSLAACQSIKDSEEGQQAKFISFGQNRYFDVVRRFAKNPYFFRP